MRVLVVEDDPDLGRQLSEALTQAGYAVDLARDGEEGHFLGDTEPYDAVVLDLGLPKMDGVRVLEKWRGAGKDMPVLILTARDRWSEKVAGFDAGADDYLTKPFVTEELLARLRAVERRRFSGTSSIVTVGDLSVDLSRSTVTVRGEPVVLTAKEWTLLRVVAARPDRVHSKAALSSALYGFDDDVGSNTLEVFVSHLRRKLGRNCIQTLRGQGYRLTGDCS